MITITTKLNQQSGFETESAILQINSYSINETIVLTTGITSMPTMPAGKQINVNYSVFKDLQAYDDKSAPFQPVGFPYNISISPAPADVIDESYIYNKVRAKLNADGYNTEWLEGSEQ